MAIPLLGGIKIHIRQKPDEKLCKPEHKVSYFLEKPKTLLPIFRQESKLGQMMSEWPESWGEASWAIDRTNHGLLFEFWSRFGSHRCWTWFHREKDVELWCTVNRCLIDLKFDREPIGIILRRSISSDLDAIVPGSPTAGRPDFASEHQSWVKHCRNDLKFDM